MKAWHKRVDVVGFNELSDHQQNEALWHYDSYDRAEEELYLKHDEVNQFWYISDFMKTSHGRYDGIAGVTNTSSLGLVLGREGDSGVIQAFG